MNNLNHATINIHNLRLRTFIGFNPEEKLKQQDVVINIEINYRINHAVFADQIESALNYKDITKQVIQLVENGRFLLLEKLVADILNTCTLNPAVMQARVCVDKPHALRFADSVSLTLHYDAATNQGINLLEKAS